MRRFEECVGCPFTTFGCTFSARCAHVVAGEDHLHARMPKLTILLEITATADRRTRFGLRPTTEVRELDPAFDAGEIALKLRQYFGEHLLFGCP